MQNNRTVLYWDVVFFRCTIDLLSIKEPTIIVISISVFLSYDAEARQHTISKEARQKLEYSKASYMDCLVAQPLAF